MGKVGTRSKSPLKLLTALCATLLSLPAHASHGPRVKTKQGKVEGKMSPDGQVRMFLGIPYAAPPIGALRWKPPMRAANWRSVRMATAFGPRCMQTAAPSSDMVFRDPGISEDCLTLNVWTPAKNKHALLPVMVWIYGGGFSAGGTSEPRQDGEHLARKGVLVVSMNYRLGVFGFLALPELAAESPQHAAGNYGFLDQSAALQWVQDNIVEFGGDPGNVTIFGESAGAFAVSAHMASPLSQGLFVRAIGESGGAFARGDMAFPPLPESEADGRRFVESAFGTDDPAKLRALGADEVLRAAAAASAPPPRIWPNLDGYFLPEPVSSVYAQGKQSHVPLLAGWNRDEGTAWVLNEPEETTLAGLRAMAERLFGPRSAEFLSAYAATNDEEALRAAEDFSGDGFIAYSTWAWLEAQTKTGDAPVYRYLFELGSPGSPFHPASSGAFHSDEIEYVFGTLDSRQGAKWRPKDYALSDQMQTYWTNFAKTGTPNAAGLPNWPTYDNAGGWQVMHLGPGSQARPDSHRDRYLFLQQVWNP